MLCRLKQGDHQRYVENNICWRMRIQSWHNGCLLDFDKNLDCCNCVIDIRINLIVRHLLMDLSSTAWKDYCIHNFIVIWILLDVSSKLDEILFYSVHQTQPRWLRNKMNCSVWSHDLKMIEHTENCNDRRNKTHHVIEHFLSLEAHHMYWCQCCHKTFVAHIKHISACHEPGWQTSKSCGH